MIRGGMGAETTPPGCAAVAGALLAFGHHEVLGRLRHPTGSPCRRAGFQQKSASEEVWKIHPSVARKLKLKRSSRPPATPGADQKKERMLRRNFRSTDYPISRFTDGPTGSSIQKLLPAPASDSTPTLPPMRSTPRFTIARPIPVPG